jgi:hypothetical protein
VAPWLITSFSLPVATATGRLVVSTLQHPPWVPIVLVTLVVGVAMASAGLLGLRRRHASRRGSNS